MPATNQSQTNKPIRWGIIGCGDVTEVKSGPAFSKVQGSRLVAVMRRIGAKAKDYAERHGVPKWYTDAAALINDPEVDAIYVATPPGSHEAYAIASLRAGKPVYVEKPMSINLAACLRMQEVAHETNGKLTIAHYRRALPMFLKVKSLLAEGVIGDIRTVRLSMLQPDKSDMIAKSGTNWRVDPAIAGAGLFYDLAPHQLDLIVYFFGTPLSSFGMSANQAGLYTAEDVVTGLIRLPNNILFTGQWCFTTDPAQEEDSMVITGSKGSISFPVFGHRIKVLTGSEEKNYDFIPPQHIQQPMVEKIVAYFSGQGENPCSAEQAILSIRIMESFVHGN